MYTEVGDDGIELGERDPIQDSCAHRPRWECLGGEPRLDVIWRKSTFGGEWARGCITHYYSWWCGMMKTYERDSGDDAIKKG